MQALSRMLMRSRSFVAVAVLAALLAGCALPLASESELETESDQQFQVDALASGGLLLRGDSREGVTLEEIGAQMRRLLEFRPARAIDCDGARRSARIVRDLLASR